MELQSVWGWQPALYLFLGGLGAGAFAVAACLFVLKKTDNRKMLAIVSWAAFGCLAVGLLLLLSELIFPLRGLMMWQSFINLTSWMTIGAWLLFVTIILILVAAVMLTDKLAVPLKLTGKDEALRIVFIVGGILSLGVCIYTGILLMSAPGVPLWNTILIPCLFTVSALDTGVALNEIVYCAVEKEPSEKVHKPLVLSTVVLIVLEAIVVVILLAMMSGGAGYAMESYAQMAQASAGVLVGGELAGWFWVAFVALGLVLPLVCALVTMKSHAAAKGHTVTYVGAAGVLIGGLTLRFLILLAGMHADVVAVEVAKMIM